MVDLLLDLLDIRLSKEDQSLVHNNLINKYFTLLKIKNIDKASDFMYINNPISRVIELLIDGLIEL